MKKLLFVFAFLGFVGAVSMNAQCAKTAAANKAAAVELASKSDNIEVKTCAKSGTTTFYEKSTCAKSGKVSMKQVSYDSASKKFINVAPATKSCAKKCTAAEKAACAAKKASCEKKCTKGASAKSASLNSSVKVEKTCSKAGAKKACCAKKAKASM